MTTRKSGKQNIRKLVKLGKTSLVVALPMATVKDLKWREKQKVVVQKSGRKLIIKDWPARNA